MHYANQQKSRMNDSHACLTTHVDWLIRIVYTMIRTKWKQKTTVSDRTIKKYWTYSTQQISLVTTLTSDISVGLQHSVVI